MRSEESSEERTEEKDEEKLRQMFPVKRNRNFGEVVRKWENPSVKRLKKLDKFRP